VIVRIVPWVGKVSVCCGGSWICGGVRGGRLASVLTWGLMLFGTGYVICGTIGGYVIWGVGGGYVIWGVGGGCGYVIWGVGGGCGWLIMA
jgi:hypothetical protein